MPLGLLRGFDSLESLIECVTDDVGDVTREFVEHMRVVDGEATLSRSVDEAVRKSSAVHSMQRAGARRPSARKA